MIKKSLRIKISQIEAKKFHSPRDKEMLEQCKDTLVELDKNEEKLRVHFEQEERIKESMKIAENETSNAFIACCQSFISEIRTKNIRKENEAVYLLGKLSLEAQERHFRMKLNKLGDSIEFGKTTQLEEDSIDETIDESISSIFLGDEKKKDKPKDLSREHLLRLKIRQFDQRLNDIKTNKEFEMGLKSKLKHKANLLIQDTNILRQRVEDIEDDMHRMNHQFKLDAAPHLGSVFKEVIIKNKLSYERDSTMKFLLEKNEILKIFNARNMQLKEQNQTIIDQHGMIHIKLGKLQEKHEITLANKRKLLGKGDKLALLKLKINNTKRFMKYLNLSTEYLQNIRNEILAGREFIPQLRLFEDDIPLSPAKRTPKNSLGVAFGGLTPSRRRSILVQGLNKSFSNYAAQSNDIDVKKSERRVSTKKSIVGSKFSRISPNLNCAMNLVFNQVPEILDTLDTFKSIIGEMEHLSISERNKIRELSEIKFEKAAHLQVLRILIQSLNQELDSLRMSLVIQKIDPEAEKPITRKLTRKLTRARFSGGADEKIDLDHNATLLRILAKVHLFIIMYTIRIGNYVNLISDITPNKVSSQILEIVEKVCNGAGDKYEDH